MWERQLSPTGSVYYDTFLSKTKCSVLETVMHDCSEICLKPAEDGALKEEVFPKNHLTDFTLSLSLGNPAFLYISSKTRFPIWYLPFLNLFINLYQKFYYEISLLEEI